MRTFYNHRLVSSKHAGGILLMIRDFFLSIGNCSLANEAEMLY